MTTKTKKPAAKPAAKKPVAKPAKQTVVSNTPAVEPTATPTAAESKPAKAAKAPKATAEPKDQQNGVTRPGAGTACRKVWNALDVLHVEGNATAANAMQKLPDINPATVRTQTQRWREFNGITRESTKTARKPDKSGAAKAATVVSKTEGAPQAN